MSVGNARQNISLLMLQSRLEAASARLVHKKPVIPMRSNLDEEVGIDWELVRHAKHMLAMRARLAELFDGNMFADPALDMVLELFVARHAGGRLSTLSLSTAGGTAPTTGLRYITKLEACGFIERHDDPHDRRRQWIKPTEACLASTRAWLREDLEGRGSRSAD